MSRAVARLDCEANLICLDNAAVTCRAVSAVGDADVTDDTRDTRGGVGESCARRADCSSGLSCVARSASKTEQSTPPMRERSASAVSPVRAGNDCEPSLVAS